MIGLMRKNLVDLPTNFSLNYWWCSGFMIGSFLMLQIGTGIILSFLYVADVNLSFMCVTEFTNDSVFSWFMRYGHIWGVSFIFILYFVHMGRALYYSSYGKVGVWNVGFILYLLMMAEAFLGYILPWHQMSYWAATVITSILQGIPVIGNSLFKYVVGGFSVTNDTLVRVFSAHVCLAFVIMGVAVLHMYYLHLKGSNNPLYLSEGYGDVVLFHSYFSVKDLFSLLCLLTGLVIILLVGPDTLLDVEGYIEADTLVTPVSIKPEWYFLAFYAMLRSVESKLGGLILVLGFLVLLWLPTMNFSCVYCEFRQSIFWWIVSIFGLLTYLGACHPVPPYVTLSKSASGLIVALMFLFKSSTVLSYEVDNEDEYVTVE
uniref:Cytochrome b n=1 Tax=Postharmostomum commutatum TaxID=2336775 RepID=A0A5C1D7T3_9TREM|nr:cytochrome b [Postharmostomum commutatum]QEL51320.1 cytochrome b [Postharmostomum commutatum]